MNSKISILLIGVNPKPISPITAPDCITQLFPILQLDMEQLDLIIVFSPIKTFGPITELEKKI